MGSGLDYAQDLLRQIKHDGLYRRMKHATVSCQHITFNKKKLLNLCSNDYLGIAGTPIGRAQMQSSSRLICGNDPLYDKLEKNLARTKSQQSALVFPTGYMANMGAITAVASKGDVIFSDDLNHASIIDACQLSGARTVIYRHNDMDDLACKISRVKKRRFIVTEGVFSMDGDMAHLDQIAEIAQKNDAVTILDDAHGDFVEGRDGRGSADAHRVAGKIDIHTSSLSKALGSFGGYVASKRCAIDLCINRSRQFIYTSALPSPLVRHALYRSRSSHKQQRRKLYKNIRIFADGLRHTGYDVGNARHIIPIIIGDEKKALAFGRYLERRGIFAQPIRYPTVAKGSARIRLSVTAWLDESDIQTALDVFESAARRFDLF